MDYSFQDVRRALARRGPVIRRNTMPVDIPTLLLVFPVVALAMALAVLIVAWGQPRGDGLLQWGAGLLMVALAFPLFILNIRAHGAQPFWMVAGNVLLSLSYALSLAAVSRFHGRPCPRLRTLLPVALAAAGALAFMRQHELRVALGGVLFGLQGAMVAHEVLRRDNASLGRGSWLLALGAGMVVLLYAQRTVGVLLGGTDVALLQVPHTLQIGSQLLGLAGLVFTTLGFILMGRERSDAEHQKLARLDMLTGVPNRRALMDALERMFAQAVRERQPLALLMVDIDRFKRVNDTYGHLAGDAVLAAVASCLGAGLRTQDILGRYGGEEFLVGLPGTDLAGAARLAERLRQSVQDMAVPWAEQSLHVTVSIGVHAQVPAGTAMADAMIDAADQAMYAAKRAGRNRVETQQAAASAAGPA